MNQHCGKHDKIYDERTPCPGCETEKAEAGKKPGHGEEGHEHEEGEEEPARKKPPPKKGPPPKKAEPPPPPWRDRRKKRP